MSYDESYVSNLQDESKTPNSFENLPEVPEDSGEIRKPKQKDRLGKGLTRIMTKANKEEKKQDDDVEDLMDEDEDKRRQKAPIKKLKKKVTRVVGEEGVVEEVVQNRSDPKEKLDKVSKNLIQFAKNIDELERIAREEINNDPNAVTSLQKERDKNSNVNFLSKLAETENNHGELLYGSYIVLNVQNEGENPRKITTKFRISDRITTFEMDREDYDPNCVFRIIPSAQYAMQTRMRDIIDDESIPEKVDIDFENFMSEMEANVDLQEDFMGKPIKYGGKFQLVQESSKRFVSIREASTKDVKRVFTEGYIDSF